MRDPVSLLIEAKESPGQSQCTVGTHAPMRVEVRSDIDGNLTRPQIGLGPVCGLPCEGSAMKIAIAAR